MWKSLILQKMLVTSETWQRCSSPSLCGPHKTYPLLGFHLPRLARRTSECGSACVYWVTLAVHAATHWCHFIAAQQHQRGEEAEVTVARFMLGKEEVPLGNPYFRRRTIIPFKIFFRITKKKLHFRASKNIWNNVSFSLWNTRKPGVNLLNKLTKVPDGRCALCATPLYRCCWTPAGLPVCD